MAGMYRRSMMIYNSPKAKFQGTKSNGRIHRYGASIFGDIIINVSKSVNTGVEMLHISNSKVPAPNIGWGPYGADRTHVGPVLAQGILLSGIFSHKHD